MNINESIKAPEKLTDWINEPKLSDLQEDYLACKPAHDLQIDKITKWKNLLDVTGPEKPVTRKGRSKVQPKLVRRQAEWRYSALTEPFLGTEKLFSVHPKTFEDEEAAKQNELVLNWQFTTKLNKVKFIDDYVRATVNEGTCIVKLAWERVTKMQSKPVPRFQPIPVQDEQTMQQLQQAMELAQANPRMYQEQVPPEIQFGVENTPQYGFPVIGSIVGYDQVQEEVIVENRPVVEVCNPQNIWIDPSCNGDFNKALFVIVSFETNKAELIKDGRYKNLDAIDWTQVSVNLEPDHETNTPLDYNFKDPTRRKTVAYEYWGFYDIDNTGILSPIVATWIGNTLIRMEKNPFPDEKLPFVLVPYLPVLRDTYGEPDAEFLSENQRILGAVTRGMIDSLARSANSQQGFAKGMLDPVNKRRFENGDDYEFNPTVANPAAGGHIEHVYPELPQSAMLMLQLQNQEAEALTGVKAFSGGLSGEGYAQKSTTSATAVRGVLDAASKRETAILRRLARGMSEIGMKIIAMNAVFLSEQEVVRVTNRQFVTIKREDLKGNFDLEVDISTAEEDNAKSETLAFLLQTIGNNVDPSLTTMILGEIADLKRMPALAEKLRNWKPDPVQQQMQQQLQQMQMQLMQAQIQKLSADAQKSQANAAESQVKAQTQAIETENKLPWDIEKIKAEVGYTNTLSGKTNAEARARELEVNEEITGINHLRDMEKLEAQAAGNRSLEIMKALSKPKKAEEREPDIDSMVGWHTIANQLNNANLSSLG